MTTRFAWRYFRSKKSTNAINIIAWISVVAIALVTAALIVVLSVFNGFEDLVKSLYSDFYTDVKIAPASGKWLNNSDSLLKIVLKEPGVKTALPILEERAILLDQEDKSIVWLKGVPPQYASVSGVPGHLVRGSFETGTVQQPAVVLGAGVENALQVEAGRSPFPITVYLPSRKASSLSDPLESLHSANAAATGSFVIQQEFDNQYAFTNLAFLQYMLDLAPGQVSAIEIFAQNPDEATSIQENLAHKLGKNYTVKTRYQQNQSLFAAMQSERLIIYAVAFLILIIAAFNIISSLTMTVLEKQQDIAVLQAMGASGSSVTTIFLKLGMLLAGIGGLAGSILGIGICLGQLRFHWVKLGGSSFLIDYYPISLRWPDFVLVGGLVLLIAFISGWLPSRKAAKTDYSLKS